MSDVNRNWSWFIGKIKIFFYSLLIVIKYIILICIFLFFIYEVRITNISVTSNVINEVIPKQIKFLSNNYMNIRLIPLLKGYTYKIDNSNMLITFLYRKPLFLFQGKIYDEEAIIMQDNLNISNYNLIEVIGNDNKFLSIYNLMSSYLKMYKKQYPNHDIKINLEYIYFRWNIKLIINNTTYVIKLPIDITENLTRKIDFLFKNTETIFNKNNKFIDLRFDKKIYIAK